MYRCRLPPPADMSNEAIAIQHDLVVQEFLKANVLHPAADLRSLPRVGYVGSDFPSATRTEVDYLRPIAERVRPVGQSVARVPRGTGARWAVGSGSWIGCLLGSLLGVVGASWAVDLRSWLGCQLGSLLGVVGLWRRGERGGDVVGCGMAWRACVPSACWSPL